MERFFSWHKLGLEPLPRKQQELEWEEEKEIAVRAAEEAAALPHQPGCPGKTQLHLHPSAATPVPIITEEE